MNWKTIALAAIGLLNQVQAQDMERKEPNILASHEILIDAPIEQVWQALAVDYGGIGKWASGVNHVIESSGEGLTGKRSCEISAAGFNDTKEKIILWQPNQHTFAYELYEGLPGMVKYSINKDQLIAEGTKTRWISSNEMRVGGVLGSTMKGFMRKKLTDVLEDKAEELKHFIETGRPHPNKLEAMAKKDSKVLFVIEQSIDAPAAKVWSVLADEFALVSNSHPVSPRSQFTNGSTSVQPGSQRIMYMTENEKKYFIDEIVRLDAVKRELLINVVEAKGYPVSFSNVEFAVDELVGGKSQLTLVFSYQTKPRFLQKMAKNSLKKQLKEYVYAIDHYSETGEKITKENWRTIRKNYPKK